MKSARMKNLRILAVLSLIGLAAVGFSQLAATGNQSGLPLPNVSIDFGGQKGNNQVSNSLQILALLTVLSLAPAILILTTAFTRIMIIFSFVRSALGTQSIPPNQVLIGLSLFLTFFIMKPTYQRIYDEALKPMQLGKLDMSQAIEKAKVPMKEFMLKSTYDKDLQLFLNMRNEHPKNPSELDIITLIPAFIISELKTAFIIGFYIFIPFLIIDLIIASTVMSMGMMMLPPVVVSLPAKLLVFVLADGWGTLIGAILAGYR